MQLSIYEYSTIKQLSKNKVINKSCQKKASSPELKYFKRYIYIYFKGKKNDNRN